eukprot:TRINITY_DN42966_c0_g1_i1.p1 TRINITY_DN42966_c0_g1~~TRINITY_DN42966_c0_g1_i1.p1  ORF type:complete len:495 (+),score=88.37 TRINITY_DN42966_c0_g1_i1:57-1487(+)
MASIPAESEREALVSQLKEIIASDDDVARALLSATNWILDDAVMLYFAGDQAEPQPSPPANGRNVGGGEVRTQTSQLESDGEDSDDEESNQEIPQQGIFATLSTGLIQYVLGVASEDFDKWFACRFGLPQPRFSNECFHDAVRTALASNQLLLLWFHKEEGAATDSLCRNILQNRTVLRMLRRSVLLWAGDVARFEPSEVAGLMNIDVFPSLAICKPLRTGFEATGLCFQWPLGTFVQPLHVISPPEAGEALLTDAVLGALTSAAEDNDESVQATQEANRRRNRRLAEERQLREEQDREFEESLLADQLAAIKRSEDQQPMELAAPSAASAPSATTSTATPAPSSSATTVVSGNGAPEEAGSGVRDEAEAAEAEERRRARGAEILATPEPVPAAGEKTAVLVVKLPSGERLKRSFRADAALDEVYEWVHCCRPEPRPRLFELCTNFPARALNDRTVTVQESDLCPNAALLMKSLDD